MSALEVYVLAGKGLNAFSVLLLLLLLLCCMFARPLHNEAV
jgi:hypothetical protein